LNETRVQNFAKFLGKTDHPICRKHKSGRELYIRCFITFKGNVSYPVVCSLIYTGPQILLSEAFVGNF